MAEINHGGNMKYGSQTEKQRNIVSRPTTETERTVFLSSATLDACSALSPAHRGSGCQVTEKLCACIKSFQNIARQEIPQSKKF